MKSRLLALVLTGFAVGVAWQTADGQHTLLKRHHPTPPACEPGFKWVEETIMQEVCRDVCKMVTETKKKWVYDWVCDPFCIPDHKHGDCGPHCAGPHARKLLVKRLVDDTCCPPTLKCVTEKIVETVPVVVYKKVPCAPGEVLPVAPKAVEPPTKKMPPANSKAAPVPAPRPVAQETRIKL